jgi:hypothetical protein
MHPAISYHLVQARIAGLHQHAQENTLARTARLRGGPRGPREGAGRPGRLIQRVRSARRGMRLTRSLSRRHLSGRGHHEQRNGRRGTPRPDDLRNENRTETAMAEMVTEARRRSLGSTGNRRVGRSTAARGFPSRTED